MTDMPHDRSGDGTDSDIDADSDIGEPLPRLEPFGPGDKEAARWNTEADAIEDWAKSVGDPEAYRQDVLHRMYEVSEPPEPPTDAPSEP